MTLAETRLLAWNTLACRSCNEPAGRRCVTASGARTTPHAPRMSDIAVWLSRQAEVDNLTTQYEDIMQMMADQRREDAATVAALQSERDNLATALEAAEEAREDALQDAADVARELAECRAGGPEPEPEPTSRYPGDPGVGNYRVGWSLKKGSTTGWDLQEAEDGAVGFRKDKISVIHDYASASQTVIDRNSITNIFARGYEVASQSCKFSGLGSSLDARLTAILNGSADAKIDSDADWCKTQGKPIWICWYHEPEDIPAASQARFRDASRYLVKRFKARDATNVAFMPIYMAPWTFIVGSSGPGYDFKNWHPDWNGTAWHTEKLMTNFGMDVYNPLINSSNHKTWKTLLDVTYNRAIAEGMQVLPALILEFGMGRTTPPEGWLQWMKDGEAERLKRDVGAICYWDNSTDIGRYSFQGPGTNDPAGKLAAWNWLCDNAVR